jgi:integrase
MTRRNRVPVPKNPGIYKETSPAGVVSYLVRYRDGQAHERTKSCRTLAEARRFKSGVQVDRDRGTELDRSGETFTFAAYAELYQYRHPEWAPSTRQAVKDRLTPINKAIGDRRLRSLTSGDVSNYVASMHARGMASSNVAAHKNLIGTILKEAVNDRLIPFNPATAVKVSRPSRSAAERSALLTTAQIDALVENMPEWWRTFAWTIALTGLRGGEAAGLTVDRVNFLTGQITIDRQLLGAARSTKAPVFGPPKTASSSRVLPMGADLANLLRGHIETHELGVDGLLFTTRTHRPMTQGQRSGAWREAANGLGLPPAARGWHALRHTYGSTLLANGVDVVTVSALLGHNGPAETLATYAHVDPTKLWESRNVAAQALHR